MNKKKHLLLNNELTETLLELLLEDAVEKILIWHFHCSKKLNHSMSKEIKLLSIGKK